MLVLEDKRQEYWSQRTGDESAGPKRTGDESTGPGGRKARVLVLGTEGESAGPGDRRRECWSPRTRRESAGTWTQNPAGEIDSKRKARMIPKENRRKQSQKGQEWVSDESR